MKIGAAVMLLVVLNLIAVSAQEAASSNAIEQELVVFFDDDKDGALNPVEKASLLKAYDRDRNGSLERREIQLAIRDLRQQREQTTKPSRVAGKPATETKKWRTTGFKQANRMGGGEKAVSDKGKFRVFVLMGQSNMQGAARADELQAPHNQKHERVRIWAHGRWEYLVPRFRFGPGVAMAHQLAEAWPHDTVGIIKIASGGTGIRAFEKNWTKERAELTYDGGKGSFYQDLMNAVAEANNISKPIFSGVVWKQGGADGTKQELANEYYTTFQQLVSDLREDLSAPDLPVFILTYANDETLSAVPMTGKRKHLKKVLMAHNQAGREIPNTITIHHGRDLPTNPDGVHFNSEGQLKLGKMAATAIEEFYQIKN